MTARPKFKEGDRVLIGKGGFGRPSTSATVAADWDGESLVMVIPEGKSKAVPRAASLLRHAESAKKPGPPLRTARPSTTQATLKSVPRPSAPARSEKYLTFVREHACMHCGRRAPTVEIEAHHWAPRRGVGQKVSDFRTVPLCRERCHQHFHDHGVLPELDKRTTFERFNAVQAELQDEWLTLLLERSKARARRTA